MAEKSIKKNFIFNIIYQALLLVSPLIVMPYVSRVLGVDGIGQYSYAHSIVSYFTLIAVLGTSMFGQRSIGYAQKNIKERSKTFWEVFLLRTITSSITLIAYFMFAWFTAGQNGFTIYLILILNIINVICDISWFFQGMEEFGKTVTTSIVFRLLYIVGLFLFVRQPSDLWIYVLLTAGQLVLGNVALWFMLPKYLCKVKGIRPFHDIKSVIQLFIPTIAVQVYVVMDKSMIGWFADGYTENGYYEQAEKVARMTLALITSLGTVMIPRISQCYKKGDNEAVKYYIYKSYRFIWMMSIPIMFGLITVASMFVPIFFGDGYEKCKLLIPILSCLTVFIGLSNVTGIQFFVPTGKQNILTMTVIVGAVVNVSLNLILIPFFASVGATIASIIAELCVTIAGFIYIQKTKQFELKRIFTCSWKYWLSGGIMMGVLYLIKYFLPTATWSLITLIVTGIIIYLAALLIFKDAFVFEIMTKSFAAIGRVFRKKNTGQTIPATDNAVAADDPSDNDATDNTDAEAADGLPDSDDAVQDTAPDEAASESSGSA